MDHGKYLTRAESEMNRAWALANPTLFTASVFEFQDKFPIADWKHHIDFGRPNYVTLIALRRESPYDMQRDYLKEIGMR